MSASRTHLLVLLLQISLLCGLSSVTAGVPKWLRDLGRGPFPDYPSETDAIVLLDEVETEVTKSGKVVELHRKAFRVLTTSGANVSWLVLPYIEGTEVSDLNAWNLKGEGVEHEVSRKDAVETQLGDQYFYSGSRLLLLQIPRVEAGCVVGYEYEISKKLRFLQKFWNPQGNLPVVRARFLLKLPQAWEFDDVAVNHPEIEPKQLGKGSWLWQVDDLEAIATEEGMPPSANLATRVAVAIYPQNDTAGKARGFSNWNSLGTWFDSLMNPQITPSSEIRDKANELESLRAISEYVRDEIRYVAIEVGTGGYRPHSASETYRRKYGDCKDKVALLRSMLRATGRDLYPVLISAHRERLVTEFPSPHFFDHVIAAVPIPEGDREPPAVLNHPELGKLLFIDITDRQTPFGELPYPLQGTKSLVIGKRACHVINTPVAGRFYNRKVRTGRFYLRSNGVLIGDVREVYRGMLARQERALFLEMQREKWIPRLEESLSFRLPGVTVGEIGLGEDKESGILSETYTLSAPYGFQRIKDLILFRPCVLGTQSRDWNLKEERKYPFQLGCLRVISEILEFSLPSDTFVEALPEPLDLDLPFASYSSSISQEGQLLKYVRKLEIKKLEAPSEEVAQLHQFYQLIKRDEGKPVLLRIKRQPVEETPASSAVDPSP